ncbi:hypothetical protein H0264_20945 [Nocardia huaxiensis]|uniref:DUF8020 domain-containing protein n=1 Tax=Nocardia huaxiensis TaxID=2755382 RepID=A0A7D6V811_9NOCA|nr:hypothetical protein [Nocardia huaxiensis]QLY27902.1 hypothetical protein H0264_20945 [Nocardia huaxiensis]
MSMRKSATVAALTLSAVCAASGALAHAQPAGDAPINYAATVSERSLTIRTDAGSLVSENGVFTIRAADGTVLGGTELSFRVDDFVFPIAAEISGNTATLTPQLDPAHAVYRPVALPYENQAPWKSEYDREVAAWSRMTSTISMGASIGTLVGGIGGAAVGCLIGGATLGAVTGTLTAMFGALGGAAVGCIVGMSVVGFLGTLAGQIFVTAPVAVLAAAQYFTTINSPMPQTK